MADRVDPLGKRALFWVPGDGERVDDPPPPVARPAATRVPRVRPGTGRSPSRPGTGSASPTGRRQDTGPGARGRRPAAASVPLGARPARPRHEPTGKRALFSAPDPPDVSPGAVGAALGAGRPPGTAPSAVRLRCATCGSWSTVSVLQFARLHLPFFLWRPGPGFARFMTCPACRRRAWISASWPAPPSGRAAPPLPD